MDAPTTLGPGHDGVALEHAATPGLDHLHELEGIETTLADVELAMTRLDDGSYGTCTVCHVVLAESILEATPTARSCPDHR